MNKILALTIVGLLAVGLYLAWGAQTPARGQAPADDVVADIHALLITGGCCHDYDEQIKILTQGISKRASVRWTVVHEGGKSRDHTVSIYSDPNWAKKYDVIVHNECFGAVRDVATIERIARAHHDGTPAVMLHCSMHSYRDADTDAWRQCVGVTSRRHEKRRPFEVKAVNAEHPIMKDFPADGWQIAEGEVYIIEKIWPDVTPLAQAYGVDTEKDHVCIWTHTYGKGRIFGTTLGHHNATMADDVFLDVVTRGLLWACGKPESATP